MLVAATWAALAAALALPVGAQIRVAAPGGGVSSRVQEAVAELARSGLQRLAPLFPGTPTKEIRFYVHPDEDSVPAALRASLHPGVPGFARLQLNEIHIVMAAVGIDPPNDLKTTVEHELVHVLLDQHVGKAGFHVARWLHEGLAQELSGDGYLGVKEEDLIFRVRGRTYIPFRDLEKRFPTESRDRLALAYGQSYSFVAFLRRELGLELLLAAARDCGPERSFRVALATRTRKGLVVYEDRWLEYLLHESGAGYRALLSNCFFFVLLAIVGPLLALAVARRRNREEHVKQRLGQQDRLEDEWLAAQAEELEGRDEAGADGEDDDVDWDDWDVGPGDPDYQGPGRREPGPRPPGPT